MKFDKFKYKIFDVAPILPQVYDETLSFYECLCRIAKRVDFLTDSVNKDFITLATKVLAKYYRDYVTANITYTEEDKGLHLNLSGIQIAGDHKYIPSEKKMRIVNEENFWKDDDINDE